MAIYTAEYRIIARCRMAVDTLIPLTIVFAGVYRKIKLIVVKCGGCPCRFSMAILTCRRELRGGMIRIISRIVLRCMTAKTGIRCGIIITVVTGGAIISNRRMCTVQGIVVIMNGKGCGLPTGLRRMTTGTIHRQVQCDVIWIERLVIIGGMACRTIGRRALITIGMTLQTISG